MDSTSGAQPVYHGGDPPDIHPEQCPDLYALWGELVSDDDPDDFDDTDDDTEDEDDDTDGSVYGAVGYVVAMPDGRTYSIRAEADPWSMGLDGVGSHHSPEGAATFYRAELIRLVPVRPVGWKDGLG